MYVHEARQHEGSEGGGLAPPFFRCRILKFDFKKPKPIFGSQELESLGVGQSVEQETS